MTDQTQVTKPAKGGVYTRKGRRYRFIAAVDDTGKAYTLRSYFSHGGPGWDYRMGLLDVPDEESLARYGHIFTIREVFGPDPMPDDIPYFNLAPIGAVQ